MINLVSSCLKGQIPKGDQRKAEGSTKLDFNPRNAIVDQLKFRQRIQWYKMESQFNDLYNSIYSDQQKLNLANNVNEELIQRDKKSNIKRERVLIYLFSMIVIFILFMIIIYIKSHDWRKIINSEQQYKCSNIKDLNKNRDKYKTKQLLIKNKKITIHIYLPQVKTKWNNCLVYGIILFIFGAYTDIKYWHEFLIQISNMGYIVVCKRESNLLDIQEDIFIQQTIWQYITTRFYEQMPSLKHKQQIIIAHSYGAIISTFLAQNTDSFDKIIVISPFYQLDIDYSICSIDILQMVSNNIIKNKQKDNYTNNLILQNDILNQQQYVKIPSISQILKIQQVQKDILNNKKCNTQYLYMILSNNEHLISNKKALELYENIKPKHKKLIITKQISHYAQGEKLKHILENILTYRLN